MVVETNRGHNLGRLITSGPAEANTGIPGNIGGFTKKGYCAPWPMAPSPPAKRSATLLSKAKLSAWSAPDPVKALIDGVLRGLIKPGSHVATGLKIGDIDPRGDAAYCDTISEKARALGGSVLEAIL